MTCVRARHSNHAKQPQRTDARPEGQHEKGLAPGTLRHDRRCGRVRVTRVARASACCASGEHSVEKSPFRNDTAVVLAGLSPPAHTSLAWILLLGLGVGVGASLSRSGAGGVSFVVMVWDATASIIRRAPCPGGIVARLWVGVGTSGRCCHSITEREGGVLSAELLFPGWPCVGRRGGCEGAFQTLKKKQRQVASSCSMAKPKPMREAQRRPGSLARSRGLHILLLKKCLLL